MVFSSIVFLLFFLPAFLLLYYLADRKYKNMIVLLSSIFFYSWGAPKFIFVILLVSFLDFYLVKWMSDSTTSWYRRMLLTLSVSVNLGLLIYFKYSNFFIENINSLLSVLGDRNIHWTKLVLPLGISFYTFETITYVVDVYRKVHKPLTNFWDYQLYIILFPKLIAGPIIRYHDLADQITDRSDNETTDDRLIGFYRFVIGLAKKVLIANHLGIQADAIFAMNYHGLDSYTAWVGILAYTFQIYFDFSGYSDMAIGLARMIGFKFPENFNNPYTSGSITEFWRRWHISLGNWMRNYLYIPLGGNRVKTKRRLYFNLWIVFLASGLWHGASWSFVLWGAYHGSFLVLERGFLHKFYEMIGKWPARVITFLLVTIGWVFFRVEKIGDAFLFLKQMFSFNFKPVMAFDPEFYTFFLLAAFFAFFTVFERGQRIQDAIFANVYTTRRHISLSLITIMLLMISIGTITTLGFNPFIYFRF
ncbi:MAG: MBOAT family O-acyltransferase [Bacteroidota bacterium]|nr:MBOAT family O-acyltransferase [Bacteroidota bacterium]